MDGLRLRRPLLTKSQVYMIKIQKYVWNHVQITVKTHKDRGWFPPKLKVNQPKPFHQPWQPKSLLPTPWCSTRGPGVPYRVEPGLPPRSRGVALCFFCFLWCRGIPWVQIVWLPRLLALVRLIYVGFLEEFAPPSLYIFTYFCIIFMFVLIQNW